MHYTFDLLLRMLLLLDCLVHAPVPIQPGVPYLLHPPLFDEPFDILCVLVFDVFSFLCIEKILILFNLAFYIFFRIYSKEGAPFPLTESISTGVQLKIE